MKEVDFSTLVGCTILDTEGLELYEEVVKFYTNKGTFQLQHDQECCEHVHLEDVVGDTLDIIGYPIIEAELVTSRKQQDDMPKLQWERDSFTWSFYKIRTIKGEIVLRWLGESNGYYSETVSFYKEDNTHE